MKLDKKNIGTLALKLVLAGAAATALTFSEPAEIKPQIKCGYYEVNRMPGPTDFIPENFREVACDEWQYHPANPNYQP